MDLLAKANLRRRVEDVDYWRQRAGWFDDDVTMQEYNSGVYDTYYQLGDDDTATRRHHSGSKHGFMRGSSGLMTFFKIGSVILAIIFGILLFRALNRRTSSSRKSGSSKHTATDSKHRPRSRSRSRSRHASSSSTNYDLMDEKSERSKRSSRSRSRSRRHSKSRSSRSRSKSRASKEVLV